VSDKFWFKFYIAEFWNVAVGLTAAQRGAYVSLLCYYWEHNGLPDNDEKLARIAGMSLKVWLRNRPSIAALFGPNWDHRRMNSLLSEWMEKSKQRSEAAAQMHRNRRSGFGIINGGRGRTASPYGDSAESPPGELRQQR
jgi:uncharacterized protein YdaU (DUF1376 family)